MPVCVVVQGPKSSATLPAHAAPAAPLRPQGMIEAGIMVAPCNPPALSSAPCEREERAYAVRLRVWFQRKRLVPGPRDDDPTTVVSFAAPQPRPSRVIVPPWLRAWRPPARFSRGANCSTLCSHAQFFIYFHITVLHPP